MPDSPQLSEKKTLELSKIQKVCDGLTPILTNFLYLSVNEKTNNFHFSIN